MPKKLTTKSRLTRKQQLFVRELVSKDGQITLREAAINAGYAATSAHTRAYERTLRPFRRSIGGVKRREIFILIKARSVTAA